MASDNRYWDEKTATDATPYPQAAYSPPSRSDCYDEKASLFTTGQGADDTQPSLRGEFLVTMDDRHPVAAVVQDYKRKERRSHNSSHHSSPKRRPDVATSRPHSRDAQDYQVRHSPTRHQHDNIPEQGEVDESLDLYLENKAMKLAVFFSGPIVLISFLTTLLTLLTTFALLLVHPIRLLVQRPARSLPDVQRSYLLPFMRLQTRCIYAHSPQAADLRLPSLLLVQLCSPLLAVGLMFWAWVMVVYWICSAIVGNPDGLDGRNDGRELVLSTRRWWLAWLRLGFAG